MGAIIGGHAAHTLAAATSVSVLGWVLILLGADAAFIVGHVAFKQGFLSDSLLHLGKDAGYPELFQYAKTGGVVALLGGLWLRTGEKVYAAWMTVFAYALADDALRIHERVGGRVAAWADLPDAFGLGGQDFGQLAVWAICLGPILALLAANYLRGSHAARIVSQDLAVLFAMLAFCGALLDLLHAAVDEGFMKSALGVMEDGGEMVAMSLICCYLLKLRRDGAPARPAWAHAVALCTQRR